MDNFRDPAFVGLFDSRRHAEDSVNIHLDQVTVIKLLPDIRGLRVLDVGAGFGDLASQLNSGGAVVTAIDASPVMVERAKERYPELASRFLAGRLEDFGWNGEFDVIVCCLVAHMIEDFPLFIKLIAEALRVNGEVILSQRHPIRTSNPAFSCGHDQVSWSVERYFDEGPRHFTWLNRPAVLFHRTLETILFAVKSAGLTVTDLCEPQPGGSNLTSRLSECREVPALLTLRCKKA